MGCTREGAYGSFLGFIIDRFEDQLSNFKVNETSANSFSAGLVRFHGNGSPSYSIQYHQMNADATASRPPEQAKGTATARGVMVSKHLNFFSREKFSAGIIVGGGVGKGQLNYTITSSSTSPEQHHENQVIPLIEVLASADIRPAKKFSIGPYYGFRNGFLMGGAALRFHFR